MARLRPIAPWVAILFFALALTALCDPFTHSDTAWKRRKASGTNIVDGLIAFYPFLTNVANAGLDHYTNGYNFSQIGTPDIDELAGIPVPSLISTDSGYYILSNKHDFSLHGDRTWVFFVSYSDPPTFGSEDVYLGKFTADWFEYYIRRGGITNGIEFTVADAIFSGSTVFNTIPVVNDWVMVTAYYDSTNEIIGLAMNLDPPETESFVGTPYFNDASSNYLGAYFASDVEPGIHIDQVMLFRRLLTRPEITNIFNYKSPFWP